ncbi:MAG: hypothetical protein ABW098_17530 [Candidatus Thiodiazotropha sp.]
MSIQLEKARKNIRDLNDKYQNREIASLSFYNELERFGVNVEKSVLISICLDGETTLVGSLIDQNGEVRIFDIDYELTQYSKCEIEEKQGFKKPQHTKERKWHDRVVAQELYNEIYG